MQASLQLFCKFVENTLRAIAIEASPLGRVSHWPSTKARLRRSGASGLEPA
jgi:hypothetical protein